MRVFVILATIALAHGVKLERTYLPPSHAGTSGGSGNFLQTPVSGNYQNGGISQTGLQTEAEFSGNGFSQTGASFSQSGFQAENAFSQPALKSNEYSGFNNFAEARPERPRAALERNAAILRLDNSNDGETFAYAFETENGIYAEENGVATNGVEAQGGYSYTGDDGQVYSIRYTADQNGYVPQGDHIPTAPPVPEEILKALEQNARDEAAGIFDDGSYNEAKYSGNSNTNQNYQQTYGNSDDTVVTNARTYPTDADTPVSSSTGSVEKAYLPPFTQARQPARSNVGSSSNIGKSYIPPVAQAIPAGISRVPSFARASGSVRGSSGPALSARGSGSNVEKAYLPPNRQSSTGFGRRQTFDSQNGYQY